MTYKNFLSFASIVALLFALGFILMPNQLMSLYNVALDAGGVLIGRLFGAVLLGFAVLNWLSRDFKDEGAKQVVLLGNLVGDGLGFIFMLFGQLGGVPGINALGWSSVLVYLVLAAGFAYLRFFAK
jgi:hypothetical protein